MLIFLFCLGFLAQGQEYAVFVDLAELEFDRLKVTIYPPEPSEESVVFTFPKFAPGGFQELKVAELVSDLSFFNQKSFSMRSEQLSDNRFLLPNAEKVRTIEYTIDDTWDLLRKSPLVFPPLGTNFDLEYGFLINFHHLIGYFEGMENYPVTVTLYAPSGFDAYTSALNTSQKGFIKRIYFDNYEDLADNPILVAPPDTASFTVESTAFNLAVVSENPIADAKMVKRAIQPVCDALFDFSGGIPLEEFQFLVYLKSGKNKPEELDQDQFGAVQHSKSAVYYFPAYSDTNFLKRQIQMTAAHEMLHIYPPLNIQTDLTSKLSYQDRQYTRHLWFFEGITEYFSLLMQLRYELISYDEFIGEVRNKINLAEVYEPFSLVKASQNIDQSGNGDDYQNFYNKGALAALLLDIRLLELTDGGLGLQGLLYRLHEKLGDGLVIKDEALIDELAGLSDTGIYPFYEDFILGTKPLPYAEYFGKLGLVFEENIKDKVRIYAIIEHGIDPGSGRVVVESMQMNFIGLQKGDIIMNIAGNDVTPQNFEYLMERVSQLSAKAPASFIVFRDGKSIELTGQPMIAIRSEKNVLLQAPSSGEGVEALKERFIHGCEFILSHIH